jgi:hypothetical protein
MSQFLTAGFIYHSASEEHNVSFVEQQRMKESGQSNIDLH